MGQDEFDQDDLQLFAHKVGIIVALESNKGNTISIEDAYEEIKSLWKKLKKKKKNSSTVNKKTT